MDSPQQHRTHQIEPLRFGDVSIPPPPPHPVMGDDPFALPPVHVSFLFLFFLWWLTIVYYIKPQYNHLPAHIAQQLAALPALPAARGRGRPLLPVSYKNVINPWLIIFRLCLMLKEEEEGEGEEEEEEDMYFLHSQ